MNMQQYVSANAWMSAMHEEKHGVSIVLCQALEKIMKDEKITFAEAYNKLLSQKRVSFIEGNYGLIINE